MSVTGEVGENKPKAPTFKDLPGGEWFTCGTSQLMYKLTNQHSTSRGFRNMLELYKGRLYWGCCPPDAEVHLVDLAVKATLR